MNFKGKVALVTGAAVGIGYATALRFAQKGADLVLFDMNVDTLKALEEKLKEYPVKILTFVGDVSDEDFVKSSVQQAMEKFGKIDILVNNAGIWRCWSSFVETPTEEWRKYIDVNLMGCVYFIQTVLPSMIANKWGRIVNVASVAGVYGNANMVHYSATKGALIALTKALAKETAEHNVLVNSVSPGSVSPSQYADVDYTQPSELCFLGRTGSTMENANLICFLASEEAGYISGQNIQIDGCRKKQ